MHSFLGMPIRSKGKIIGNLYLADKLIGDGEHVRQVPFTQQDQDILEMFATQAAIAIENAHLYRQSEQLAVLQERERFGMDLHDGIIQSIYAIGLMLEDAQHRSATDPDQARRLVAQSITGLNNVISDIRNYILDLRPQRFQGRDLSRGLRELAREVRANSFLDVTLEIDPLPQCSLPAEVTVEVLHVVQEALSNIQKHAQARHVQIRSFCSKDRLFLSVMDDGNGIDPEAIDQATGNGIRNMRERIRNHGGTFEIEPGPKGGTVVSLSVPLGSDETEFAETMAESRRAV
jgi:signal transduction histidine kinase